jgi:Spy/CpxP family protein refolding chaperone
MQRRFKVIAIPIIILSVIGSAVFTYSRASSQVVQSPYVKQLSSPVRGLSEQEVDDLLNGRGAGYARMAELNSYPGPAHILEMKKQLNLSAEQTQKIEAAFESMNAEAKRIGKNIVKSEQELSTSFASGTITPGKLQTQTELLAALYGELRATHLKAHLEVTPLLSPRQITAYNTLRGYLRSEVPNVHYKN